MPSNVIDITDLVEKTRSTFVDWAVLYIFGLEVAVPGLEWVSLPVIKEVDQEIIKLILDALTKSAVMGAFFLNTAIRKASQAQDFVDAVNAIEKLPKDVSQDDFEKARRRQMSAFANFVVLTA